jgi:hypothetical protein
MSEISFLKKLDIRAVWKKEDQDFTPWIAAPEPLNYLFRECGIEVEDLGTSTKIQTEVLIPGVGRRLDILVTLSDGTKIAIENQFNSLDHDHLTRSLAYAVGLEVSTVVIVAESHRSEFVNVANYLNSAASAYDHGIKFFLVQIDVLSAEGANKVFPNFKLIVGPDEWRGAIEEIQSDNPKSEASALIYNFHEMALPFLREATGVFQNVSPSKNFWKASGLGFAGIQLCINSSRDYTKVQIWIHKGNDPEYNTKVYEVYEKYREEISIALSPYELAWRNQDTGIIEITLPDFGYRTEPTEEQFRELARVAARLADTARKYFDQIRLVVTE